MKKLIVILATLLMFASPALAEPEFQYDCRDVGKLAIAAMEARQSGVPEEKLMAVVKGEPLYSLIVETAFRVPLAVTIEKQLDVIDQFGGVWLNACVDTQKEFGKRKI